jgi:adenylate kinase
MEKRWVCEACDKTFVVESLANKPENCDACGGKLIRRNDDTAEVLQRRMAVYRNETAPLLKFYQDKGKLIKVNGNPAISEVEKEIWEKVNELN